MARHRGDGPLHRELADRLRAQIEGGTYQAGDRIPTELEIGQEHGVSRTTVREAVHQLVQDGLLERQQGRGTFVREAPGVIGDRQAPPHAHPAYRFISAEWITASHELIAAFDLAAAQPVFSMVRLTLTNDKPTTVTRYYSVLDVLRKRPPDRRERVGARFDEILSRRGVVLTRSNVLFEPRLLDAAEAAYFGAEPGALTLRTERVGFDESGRPVRVSLTTITPNHRQLMWTIRQPQPQKGRPESHSFPIWTFAALE